MTVPPGTPMASHAARREEIAQKLYIDIPVPRWSDPKIIVRYRPLTQAEVTEAGEAVKRAGSKTKAEAALSANIKGLVKSCVGIYALFGDETYSLDADDPEKWLPFDPDTDEPEWMRFDDVLGAALGVEEKSAAAVCRTLFHTEGDLLGHAAELAVFSGFSDQKIDEEFSGE